MVQFNLLPDVKLEYVKTQRTKRLLTVVSVAVSIVSIGVLLLSFILVNVIQKKSLSDLSKDVSKSSTQLKSISDLDKILTVQNQLGTLTKLHDDKPVTSRLFAYVTQLTPASASLNKISIDFKQNTMTIGGKAPSLDTVSSYTDTLKSTKFTTSDNSTATAAFKSVVLSTFGRDDKGATFTITMNFIPEIFNSKESVTLKVPSTASTNQSNVFQEGN